ncbi:MAG: hypothetical protein ABSB78_05385 [Bacteroidota bacterium]
MSFFFKVFLKIGYMFCWSVIGFFAGVFATMTEEHGTADKSTGTQILISSLLFAVIGLLVPWGVVKRISGFVARPVESAPIIFRIILVILVVVLLFNYKWVLIYLSEIWLEYF